MFTLSDCMLLEILLVPLLPTFTPQLYVMMPVKMEDRVSVPIPVCVHQLGQTQLVNLVHCSLCTSNVKHAHSYEHCK